MTNPTQADQTELTDLRAKNETTGLNTTEKARLAVLERENVNRVPSQNPRNTENTPAPVKSTEVRWGPGNLTVACSRCKTKNVGLDAAATNSFRCAACGQRSIVAGASAQTTGELGVTTPAKGSTLDQREAAEDAKP